MWIITEHDLNVWSSSKEIEKPPFSIFLEKSFPEKFRKVLCFYRREYFALLLLKIYRLIVKLFYKNYSLQNWQKPTQ